jgi:phosphatidylserine/phosphatidylglycerophosphate/cardiolipin synthase-like enzyme
VQLSSGAPAPKKEQAIDEWRRLTSVEVPALKAFVRDHEIRMFFKDSNVVVGFHAEYGRSRVRADGFQVSAALLHLDGKVAEGKENLPDWKAATVIGGAEWRSLATNLVAALTPRAPGHGVYYRGLAGDRFLYRDTNGACRLAPVSRTNGTTEIDHAYSIEETIRILGNVFEAKLAKDFPSETLFLIVPRSGPRLFQPLLLDRKHRSCVWLSPSSLVNSTEPGFGLTKSWRGFRALIFEGYVVAIIKSPFSSAARLGNLIVQLTTSLVRLPLPSAKKPVPSLAQTNGMDLGEWEAWLDRHTHTRREHGAVELLVDGEKFFPRVEKAISQATNHIHMDVFIFDTDDVAVEFANRLKMRSTNIEAHLVIDRLGSIAAAMVPPTTPPPKDFVPPASSAAYLKEGSNVKVRPFLNPFFSYDHSKVYLVDGGTAWLGGMNVGREYRYEWHDMMVELHGPVVHSLEREFELDWAHAGPFGDFAYFAAELSHPKSPVIETTTNRTVEVRLLPTKTLWKPFTKAVLGALDHAKSYVYVENPYIFDKRVIKGLMSARSRGVDVRVILPHVLDTATGARAELVTANYLLEHGVRVYYYPGMSHVKAFLADDWACVGSGNLNQFGLGLCQEHNVATTDPEFVNRLKQDLFEDDFVRAFELTQPLSVEWMDYVADVMLEGL